MAICGLDVSARRYTRRSVRAFSKTEKAAAGWATVGVTVADGVYTANSTITVAADTVALNKISARTGAGSVTIKGMLTT